MCWVYVYMKKKAIYDNCCRITFYPTILSIKKAKYAQYLALMPRTQIIMLKAVRIISF